MYFKTSYQSPIGRLTLASDGEALIGLWLENQKYFAATVREEMADEHDLPVLAAAQDWLDRYFAGEKPAIGLLPLAPGGGAFRQEVWKILCGIPYGATLSYGEIAQRIAVRLNKTGMSAQAVGGAVGHNPISIIIPCHRAVGTDGSLTGYAGGVDKKAWLLTHEGAEMTKLKMPSIGTAL